jgi:hypothetical protein
MRQASREQAGMQPVSVERRVMLSGSLSPDRSPRDLMLSGVKPPDPIRPASTGLDTMQVVSARRRYTGLGRKSRRIEARAIVLGDRRSAVMRSQHHPPDRMAMAMPTKRVRLAARHLPSSRTAHAGTATGIEQVRLDRQTPSSPAQFTGMATGTRERHQRPARQTPPVRAHPMVMATETRGQRQQPVRQTLPARAQRMETATGTKERHQ